jgi:Fe-S cluster assembly protein SufD
MTQAVATAASYREHFEALAPGRRGEPGWLRQLREEAFSKFEEIGFPVGEKRDEAWKYTDVRPIAERDFRLPPAPTVVPDVAHLIPDDGGALRMVFIDGYFSPECSSELQAEGVTVARLTDAVRDHEEIVRNHIARFAELGHDSFVPLNFAFHRDGAFIRATGVAARPVHAVFIATGQVDGIVTYPRVLLTAAEHAEVTFIETYLSAGEGNHFTDSVTEVEVHAGAKVRHVRLLLENQASYQVAHVRPFIGRDASFESAVIEAGGGLSRLDLESVLCEEGANATLHGLYITAGDQHIDNLVSIDHERPHGTSRLYYKGILDERSTAVFGGTVFVRKGADKTDAHQEDKNLILSEDAQVHSKPALEIEADDVKAGHGATAGAITGDALFYLQSRGIDEQTAMQLLVRGFASEIIDKVPVDELRHWLEQRVMQALPRFRTVVKA